MARGATRKQEPLPPPLPPETRTVGQLVAEALYFYKRRFWPSLALGIAPAAAGVVTAELPTWMRLPVVLTVGAAASSSSYALASEMVAGLSRSVRRVLVATGVGIVALAPAVLMLVFLNVLGLLPAVFWLGLFGLVVPVAVIEGRLSYRRA